MLKKNDWDAMKDIISSALNSEDYFGEFVELGENWELIAFIFYTKGVEDAKMLKSN